MNIRVVALTVTMLAACLPGIAMPGTAAAGASDDAQSFEGALAAADRRDYATAIELMKPLASAGNIVAQLLLGSFYENRGYDPDIAGQPAHDAQAAVKQDWLEAAKWYRLAADHGNVQAQIKLGAMYDLGKGVAQDFTQALQWYGVAAKQGDAGAETALGIMYDQGKGVRPDFAEAVKWWRMAAEQGNAAAQQWLGVMYIKGQGVPQDYVQAYMWYVLASSRTSSFRGAMLKELEELAHMMTPGQIEEARKLAREWTPK